MKTAEPVPVYGPGVVSLERIVRDISPERIRTMAHKDRVVLAHLLPGTTVDILTISNSVEMRCG